MRRCLSCVTDPEHHFPLHRQSRTSDDVFLDPPDIVDDERAGKQSRELYSQFSRVISPVEVDRASANVNMSTSLSRDPSKTFQRMNSTKPQLAGAASLSRMWSDSRKVLEEAIQTQKSEDRAHQEPDLMAQETRLQKRLGKFKLDMHVMAGDGNCQFRSVSFGLYGDPQHHRSVRLKAVQYMRAHKDDFQCFVGESFQEYVRNMAKDGSWGDELTLRAISDSYGIVVNVITSDQHNWFMRYKPDTLQLSLEIFLTYIAPVHYNAIRRQTSGQQLLRKLSHSNSSKIQEALDREQRRSRGTGDMELDNGELVTLDPPEQAQAIVVM
ncbi:hypothetical protein WJX72_005737 [[Myrmecia] bisecta]|uniref:OTU domain-containing protein n=1 Tax=[Myrmecia] bisecta TaxID=41462 RepID=A0AAW1P6D0_9CHLO